MFKNGVIGLSNSDIVPPMTLKMWSDLSNQKKQRQQPLSDYSARSMMLNVPARDWRHYSNRFSKQFKQFLTVCSFGGYGSPGRGLDGYPKLRPGAWAFSAVGVTKRHLLLDVDDWCAQLRNVLCKLIAIIYSQTIRDFSSQNRLELIEAVFSCYNNHSTASSSQDLTVQNKSEFSCR